MFIDAAVTDPPPSSYQLYQTNIFGLPERYVGPAVAFTQSEAIAQVRLTVMPVPAPPLVKPMPTKPGSLDLPYVLISSEGGAPIEVATVYTEDQPGLIGVETVKPALEPADHGIGGLGRSIWCKFFPRAKACKTG